MRLPAVEDMLVTCRSSRRRVAVAEGHAHAEAGIEDPRARPRRLEVIALVDETARSRRSR